MSYNQISENVTEKRIMLKSHQAKYIKCLCKNCGLCFGERCCHQGGPVARNPTKKRNRTKLSSQGGFCPKQRCQKWLKRPWRIIATTLEPKNAAQRPESHPKYVGKYYNFFGLGYRAREMFKAGKLKNRKILRIFRVKLRRSM